MSLTSASVSVSIEISELDSDQNPQQMISYCPVELLLAGMFFEYMTSKLLIESYSQQFQKPIKQTEHNL